MERFNQLLSLYEDEALDPAGRAELAACIDADPYCLEAFLDAVSEQRIRRLELQSN
jgi:hypothetical protein